MTDEPTTPPAEPTDGTGSGSEGGRDLGQMVAAAGETVTGIARDIADKAGPTIKSAAEKATPAVREVTAKAAEVAAAAASAAGPIAHKVADVTGDVGDKIAERSRGFAADVRKASEGAVDTVGDGHRPGPLGDVRADRRGRGDRREGEGRRRRRDRGHDRHAARLTAPGPADGPATIGRP